MAQGPPAIRGRGIFVDMYFLPKSCKWNVDPSNVTFLSFRAMFHFHDSGRKGISKAVVKFTFNWFYPRGKLAYPIEQEKENHFQPCLGMGHVRSQEGMILDQGGGFKCFLFSPLCGEMIQFDDHIFNWVVQKTNQLGMI